MRLRTDFWVAAYIRRCELEGAFAVLRRRGAPEAGAIFIKIENLCGSAALYGPAPQSELQDGHERLFARLLDQMGAPGPVIATTETPHFRRIALAGARAAERNGGAQSHRPGHAAAGIRSGNGIMFVSHTGEVRPSGFFAYSAGNVRTASPVELYCGSRLFRALRRPDFLGGRCGHCEWREVCGGSRSRALAATGDPLAEDPLCLYEPAARRA